ncbi:hypothetical protein M404DRAFT_630485 [Pisolithus tinctorius Marx 270]|uniref:Uncharacterized protein n=1 Tax=Pisolithus tinctorius Marx 270 TaxID=870435 RepID=A0A0C3K076_PISTI|nr:hypothetical protein M404DRAFT_630485 [Pisolithus tinctorius Marx 270]
MLKNTSHKYFTFHVIRIWEAENPLSEFVNQFRCYSASASWIARRAGVLFTTAASGRKSSDRSRPFRKSQKDYVIFQADTSSTSISYPVLLVYEELHEVLSMAIQDMTGRSDTGCTWRPIRMSSFNRPAGM